MLVLVPSACVDGGGVVGIDDGGVGVVVIGVAVIGSSPLIATIHTFLLAWDGS